MTGQRKAAQARLDGVEFCCTALPNEVGKVSRGEVAAVRATLAIAEADAPRIIEQAHLALASLHEDDLVMRAHVANVLGIGHRYSGDALAAEKVVGEAARLGELAGDTTIVTTAAGLRANLLAEQGKLREAVEAYRQLDARSAQFGRRPQPVLGETYIGAGAVLREWNDLNGAMLFIDKGFELARQGDLHLVVIDGYIASARVAQARREPAKALDLIEQAFEHGRQHEQPLRNGQLMAWRARLQLMQDDLAGAIRWAEECGLALDQAVPYRQEDPYLTLTRVLIAQARASRRAEAPPGVAGLLERLLSAAQSGGRMARVLEILVLQALAAEAQGRQTQALANSRAGAAAGRTRRLLAHVPRRGRASHETAGEAQGFPAQLRRAGRGDLARSWRATRGRLRRAGYRTPAGLYREVA